MNAQVQQDTINSTNTSSFEVNVHVCEGWEQFHMVKISSQKLQFQNVSAGKQNPNTTVQRGDVGWNPQRMDAVKGKHFISRPVLDAGWSRCVM